MSIWWRCVDPVSQRISGNTLLRAQLVPVTSKWVLQLPCLHLVMFTQVSGALLGCDFTPVELAPLSLPLASTPISGASRAPFLSPYCWDTNYVTLQRLWHYRGQLEYTLSRFSRFHSEAFGRFATRGLLGAFLGRRKSGISIPRSRLHLCPARAADPASGKRSRGFFSRAHARERNCTDRGGARRRRAAGRQAVNVVAWRRLRRSQALEARGHRGSRQWVCTARSLSRDTRTRRRARPPLRARGSEPSFKQPTGARSHLNLFWSAADPFPPRQCTRPGWWDRPCCQLPRGYLVYSHSIPRVMGTIECFSGWSSGVHANSRHFFTGSARGGRPVPL